MKNLFERTKQWLCGLFGRHHLIKPHYIVGEIDEEIADPKDFMPMHLTPQYKNTDWENTRVVYLGPTAECSHCGLRFGLKEWPSA